MERALRESENLVRSILEAAPVPVAMVRSQDGLVVYESPASRKIFGRLLHSGEPSYISDLYVDPEDRRRYLALLREKGSVEGYEVQLRRYDGQPIWVAITASLRSEEHTSELQSLMRISYAVFCLKKKKTILKQ